MAVGSNLLSTYDIGFAAASSNKESVFETIQNIAPWDTPLFSSAPKVSVSLTTFEWFTDTLAATSTAGTGEGEIISAAARSNRVRRANNTQIFTVGIEVSDSQAAANPYGISGEFPYQGMLAMREVARNIESRAWVNSGFERITGAESGGATTARITASLRATGWGTPQTSAVNGAISTAAVENLFELVALQGGNPDKFFLSLGEKADFSNVAMASGVNRMFNLAAADKRLIANVTVYEGNYGTLQVIPDKFIPQSSLTADANAAGLIESGRMKVGIYRPMKSVPLAKVGESTRGYIVTELGFMNLHASAHGFLTGLTT
jgi:hypothetical protein